MRPVAQRKLRQASQRRRHMLQENCEALFASNCVVTGKAFMMTVLPK